ncbi:23S rRNA (uracil(1939)-C(5))-methyltransferase RlmD [Ferrimonas senticii]|uniref:23S rRNA (uracil(1939)-C(5))-methyltransferase RlmD n=1 Tax=Ferrimonas senticii TaxID=394566 RepID=UPI0003FF841B|nr:23S rRNA (uracil(1939)-C(5))-methyltransferase RlmD [Ferrimonas senticii]
MAQFFSPKSSKKKPLAKSIELTADALDHQAQAVASVDGKRVFVAGLLPEERAKVQLTKDKGRFATGKVLKRLSDSPERCAPRCRHFGVCGGCQLQYANAPAQRQWKQQALTTLLSHHLKQPLPPLTAPIAAGEWHYRRRARLGTAFHQGQLQLGFRKAQSNEVIALRECPVLAPSLQALIAPLAACLGPMALAKALGHIDLLLVDEGAVVVLRLMRAINDKERTRLTDFADKQGCLLRLDNGQQIIDLDGKPSAPLHYQTGNQLPAAAMLPGDFYQVNDQVNQQMVAQALEWLAPTADEVGLDLFCGGGNFTLPLATRAKQVIGVEGIEAMAERGRARAAELGLANVEFYSADLNGEVPQANWAKTTIDWALLDPARAGAGGALAWLPKLAPKRVLYVSCNPLSLAQDAKLLSQHGYQLTKLGLVDMFPHTGHLESMALFVRA